MRVCPSPWRIGAILAVLAITGPAAAGTYAVTPDGTGDFPTIQAAIDACGSGDVILLADGVFTGNGNRDIEYKGKSITVRSQSGDPEACIIDCGGTPEEFHRGFYFSMQEAPDARLEAVMIRNGVAGGDD